MKKVKNITNFIAILTIASCLFSSCSSHKDTTKYSKNSEEEVLVEEDECQLLAEKKPTTRAWGEATNHRLSYAKSYAEGQARAALARQVASIIKTATKESDLAYEKFSASQSEGHGVTDEGSGADGFAQQIADQTLSNVVVIKTTQKMKKNGQYHVFVCVEYKGNSSELVKDISDNVKQRVSDEERIKMQYQFQKFQESIEKELNKQNNAQ